MTLALACAASLVIGYALGCTTASKVIEHRQSKARDLAAMIRVAILGHVGDAQ